MSDVFCSQATALAKASVVPVLYAAFFVWSYAILLNAKVRRALRPEVELSSAPGGRGTPAAPADARPARS